MILTFPNLDTLRLALTTGAVPSGVGMAPALAGVEDDGRVWLQPSVAPSRTAQAELRRLGAQVGKSAGAAPGVEVSCWLELLPLERAEALARPEQTPVLFELSASEQLSPLVSEMLRLGNDRQGYRWLEDPKGKVGTRALLRVVGPPYYSLLRALDRDGQRDAPIAYVEQSPRVWVQFGYRHPMADHLRPPQGKLLFLRPPRQWSLLEEAPFKDIYEALEFSLPETKTRWREGELGQRLVVPLTLTRGGPNDTAALWVLRDNPVEQIDTLVRNADDQLLGRLAFAVGERGSKKVIILRVRPSRLAPPELALSAVAFRHFSKLPNLFLPVGHTLKPPLRRDAVRKLLADDPAIITWLYPQDGGGFTPESVPDSAFRPLSDWIDYVLEHDRDALQVWMESAQFDFEQFVCDEETASDKPKKPPRPPREKLSSSSREPGGARGEPRASQTGENEQNGPEALLEEDEFAIPVETAPDELKLQLTALEERFLAVEGGLDAPERQAMWPEMAALNGRAGTADDAGICWAHALWVGGPPAAWTWNWFRAEAAAVPHRRDGGQPGGRTWASRASLAPRGTAVDGIDLDRLLATAEPDTADVSTLAAYLCWAGSQKTPPASLVERLGRLQHYLETHERLIPVRAVWLAWLGLARMAEGDALALARTRDRILERLFRTGLRPEQELPSFLRFSGEAGTQRFRAVRHWMAQLAEKARDWVLEKGVTRTYGSRKPKTEFYSDLMFAYGLAQLGEVDASNRLLQRATDALHEQGEAHQFLLEAFAYRISQAREGKPRKGPLPTEFMEELNDIIDRRRQSNDKSGATQEYIIDRMRFLSRILEPDQKVEPYRHAVPFMNELARALGELPDVLDREELVRRVRGLLQKVGKGREAPAVPAQILRTALDQARRVGEEFALEMLALTPPTLDALPAPAPAEFADHADLLEKGLAVAGHFDRTEYVTMMVARFQKLLQTQRDVPPAQGLDSLAGQCFRGLRKMGMHKECDQLLTQMAAVVLKGAELQSLGADWGTKNLEALRTLLHVAGGWYFFGRETQADLVMKAARATLFAPPPKKDNQQTGFGNQDVRQRALLARTYAGALGQAPVEVVQKRLEELFDRFGGLVDTFTTNEYYSQLQLLVLDGVVLAVVSDESTASGGVRRWLDEDEFLIRRRIHSDVRKFVQ